MASVSYQIANLLEKMQSSDKDFRFMATNDLMAELQKDSIKLDDDSERKVVRMILRLLEDKNGEVQNLAVKCLGPLVNKVKEYQVDTIVEALCTNMVSDKEQLRDISSIGLKTVIAEIPQSLGCLSAGAICKRITVRLTTAIERQDDVSVQLEALDIITDLLLRFGPVLNTFHHLILAALLPQLESPRQAVRKRTISALSNLVLSCNNSLYVKLIEFLESSLKQLPITTQNRTYIQCVSAVCRQSGHKFGDHMNRFVPTVLSQIEVEDDELREYCLQAFESFVLRCPKEISPDIFKIIDLCLAFCVYDPNYNYGHEDEKNVIEEEDEDEEDGTENDEYSDDDDMSWKVRRAAAKCLEAIFSCRTEMLATFYKTAGPLLIARFKEREENVKSDIFHAYIALVKQTKASATIDIESDAMVLEEEDDFCAVIWLQRQIPEIVMAIQPLLKEKSIRTRQDCLILLKEVCSVIPGGLCDYIGYLIPGLLYSLGEKNASTNMKIDALSFINTLIISHPPKAFHPYVSTILKPVIVAVGDGFYKITAEALGVLEELVKVIRPMQVHTGFDFTPYTKDIYACTLMRLKTSDIDQEVKEKAISTMGQVICNLGDQLKSELPHCFPLFLDRLKNEITRLITVKALKKIAGSPLKIDLPILSEAVPILALFLRKNQRTLKLWTLQLIHCLVNNYYKKMSAVMLTPIMAEIPPLLDESDVYIAQWTLTTLTAMAAYHPRVMRDVNNGILPQALSLVKSPLLQGSALNAMLEFFKVLVKCSIPGLSFDHLLRLFLAPVANPCNNTSAALHKQAYYSLAKCVAAITVNNQDKAMAVVGQFISEIEKAPSDAQHMFALLVVGEIGRELSRCSRIMTRSEKRRRSGLRINGPDLTFISNLKQVIVGSFTSVTEEVKSAASYALGSLCVGNLQLYLPFILKESREQPRRQYLLLHSLKEVITCLSKSQQGIQQILPFVPDIWTQLYNHCECQEEGTRNVVAECLGKLTLIDPANLLPKLRESLNSPSPLMRTTVVTAVKFTISDQPSTIDPLLKNSIGHFLNTLQDSDLNVRRVALVAFNSAAHNKPALIRDLLSSILPQLYNETNIKRDLIREVEMGPFKHTVDDGLDIRKAAFECMYTLLDSCLDKIDIFEFINHVEYGLKDHYDIKMLTYLMVARLAQIRAGFVLQRLDKLIEPLRATLNLKVKANSVKQEYEKQDELKRSAMRAVVALLKIPDADKNPHLNEFMNQIKNSSDLFPIFDSIQKDSSAGHGDFLMDQS